MTPIIIVRAVAFGSCFVRRLILSTTDKFEPLTIYDKNYTSVGYASEVTFSLPGDISVGPFYIQCKFQNVLSSCRPVLDTYPI